MVVIKKNLLCPLCIKASTWMIHDRVIKCWLRKFLSPYPLFPSLCRLRLWKFRGSCVVYVSSVPWWYSFSLSHRHRAIQQLARHGDTSATGCVAAVLAPPSTTGSPTSTPKYLINIIKMHSSSCLINNYAGCNAPCPNFIIHVFSSWTDNKH